MFPVTYVNRIYLKARTVNELLIEAIIVKDINRYLVIKLATLILLKRIFKVVKSSTAISESDIDDKSPQKHLIEKTNDKDD